MPNKRPAHCSNSAEFPRPAASSVFALAVAAALSACADDAETGVADAGGTEDVADSDATTGGDADASALDAAVDSGVAADAIDAADVTHDSDTRSDDAADAEPDTWEADDQGRIVAVAGGCESVVVATRFDFGWQHRNHRISQLGWLAEGTGPRCVPEAFSVTFVGGDFTTGAVDVDDAIVELDWARIELGAPRAAIVRVEGVTPSSGTRSGSFAVDRAALGLPDTGALAVFVQGVHFTTDVAPRPGYPDDYDPALGYTSRGIGAGATLDPAALVETVDWTLRFEPGVAYDVFIRADHNAAVPYARAAATLDLALVVVDSRVRTAATSYSQVTDEPWDMTEELEPAAAEDDRTVVLPGEGSGDAGVVAIGAFDMRLYPDGQCTRNRDCDSGDSCGEDGLCLFSTGLPGDYVRRLAGGVESTRFEGETATMRVVSAGYASTASEAFAFRPLNLAYEGEVVWVDNVNHDEGSGSAVFPAGSTRFDVAHE